MWKDLTGLFKMSLLIMRLMWPPMTSRGLIKKLKDWLMYYNNIRPHQSLGYMTPNNYLVQLQKGNA